MAMRRILFSEVQHVVDNGEIIETYPDDTPLPSRLMMAFCGKRPIHVVCANHPSDPGDTHIITVYEPKKEEWDESFRIRRRLET